MEVADRRIEGFLRLSAILSLVLTVLLLGFDHQTKEIFGAKKKASFRDFDAFLVMVYVDSVAAGYNLLQLFKCWISAHPKGSFKLPPSNIYQSWVFFLLDQVAVYITFAANIAAMEASLLAVTGAHNLQWMKLCNRYTKFCYQVGASLLFGLLAFLLMAVISSISAFNLFAHYSPKKFLILKPIPNNK